MQVCIDINTFYIWCCSFEKYSNIRNIVIHLWNVKPSGADVSLSCSILFILSTSVNIGVWSRSGCVNGRVVGALRRVVEVGSNDGFEIISLFVMIVGIGLSTKVIRFSSFKYCSSKWRIHVPLFFVSSQSARLTNLIQRHLSSGLLGKTKTGVYIDSFWSSSSPECFLLHSHSDNPQHSTFSPYLY